jgi:hypothetical protein
LAGYGLLVKLLLPLPLLMLAVCLTASLRTETLRDIKGNMGQYKSKEKGFKEL